jgi:hypothetical protein
MDKSSLVLVLVSLVLFHTSASFAKENNKHPYVKVIDANNYNLDENGEEEAASVEQHAEANEEIGLGDAGGGGEDYREHSLSLVSSSKLVAPYAEQPVEYRRVCVYPNWSILRDSNLAKIYPEDIDPNLCTHIHYAYANIDVRTLQLSPSQYQDFNSGDHGAVCDFYLITIIILFKYWSWYTFFLHFFTPINEIKTKMKIAFLRKFT